MEISNTPSEAELSAMVREELLHSIERAKLPPWRVALTPMLFGAVFTLALMVLAKWLVEIGLL
jgi:hypothetical protein